MTAGLSKLATAASVMLIVGGIGAGSADAQVTLDGSANRHFRGPAPFADRNYDIRAELGRQAGHNLFHSFGKFSLRTGESATFSAPDEAGVQRVISRVTGGERSDIDGTIRSTIPGADFYFINPAGVMFGPNASLDVQGSFHVSTADELRFADGTKFSATNPASSFTVARPEAFGFLGAREPAPIRVDRSSLEVPAGKSFSIVGGDITIQGDPDAEDSGGPGTVRAGAGQITLAAIGAAGEVRTDSGIIDAAQKADISLTDQASVDTSGDGGGTIRIRGGQLLVENDSLVSADNTGATDATVGIDVQADTVGVFESALSAYVLGSGAGGDMSITATDIKIHAGSRIISDSWGSGDGGTIRIEADRAEIAGGVYLSQITSSSGDVRGADGGAIIVIAREFIMRNGGELATDAFEGRGGDVIIMARDFEIHSSSHIYSFTHRAGDGGSIIIVADNLDIDDNSGIATFGVDEPGNAGATTITAGDIRISGRSEISSSTSGLHAAGRIQIIADEIILTDSSRIDSSWVLTFSLVSTDSLGPLFLETSSPLTASDVETLTGIDAEVLDVFGTSFFLSPEGEIFQIGSFDGEEEDAAFLPRGAGPAGDIFLSAGRVTIENSFVDTKSPASAGGRIEIEAARLIDLSDASVISDGIRPSDGDSVITLRAPRIAVNGSRITSLTTKGQPLAGSGEARILGGLTVISADSGVAASSTVQVTGQEGDLGSRLVTVEGVFLDPAPLRARCGARQDIGASSFTGVGRGGLPASPDAPLSSAKLSGPGTSGGLGQPARVPAAFERAAGAPAPCRGAR